ncbi:GSCFA domain protein [Putridiphycobacter roseus]|uniref:GSCFA domain protein n=1 Tax=Putridiphycobacter roseus TaxID=2219161 RepID=A0A2W1NEE8_9FLAO|nr:GSCFA domain-containing protein [Putridiphycobacter roseus]PZE17483.1 GSCFA domain protein [Putridiphycobacter roseus]
MKFRTEIKPIVRDLKVSHQSKIMAIGSCFVENIGGILKTQGFDIDMNPFGILFNPISILNILNEEIDLTEKHLIDKGTHVVSLDFHSKYHHPSKEKFRQAYATDRVKLQNNLKNLDLLILTFGTAWVYEYVESKKTIANCQKLNDRLFNKKLLDLNDLNSNYTQVLLKLLQGNPNLKILLTVSPVRHIKDGIIENSTSKALLLMLCQHLKTSFPKQVIYYPSYELVMDDLRDYRFYEADLIHPNGQAIQYIYENFSDSFFSDKTKQLVLLKKKLNAMKAHVFLNASPAEIALHHAKMDKLALEIKNAV